MSCSLDSIGLLIPRQLMVWAAPGGYLRHDCSQAVRPGLAQGACAAEVLNPRLGRGKSPVQHQGCEGSCMMDWVARQVRYCIFSNAGLSDIDNIDTKCEGSVEMSVHVSPLVLVSLIPAYPWSDFPCARQGGSIPRDVWMSYQGLTKQRP